MAKRTTNDGKSGGLIGGQPHTKGGVAAVVVDAGNQPVEIEKDEVIINKKAVAKHWKTLDKINQSTGGAPIAKPVGAKADTGGKITASPEFQAGDLVRAIWGMFPTPIRLNFRLIRSAGDKLEVINLLTKETKTIDKSEATLYMRAGVAASPNSAPLEAVVQSMRRDQKKEAKDDNKEAKKVAKIERREAAVKKMAEQAVKERVEQKPPKPDSRTHTEIDTMRALKLFVANNFKKDITYMDEAQTMKETMEKFILDVESEDGNTNIDLNPFANVHAEIVRTKGQ